MNDVAAALATVRDGEGPGVRAVMPQLRELLDSDLVVAYGLVRTASSLGVDFVWGRGSGFDPRRAGRGLQVVLDHTPRFGLFDPFCPEPSQRNRIAHHPEPPAEHLPIGGAYAANGMAGKAQLRTLLCEGDSLLAWVGVLRAGPFGARETGLFRRLVEPLRRRALLDRHLTLAPAALQLLGAAMEAIGAPAYLLRRGAVVHANAAGRASLDADRPATLAILRAHLAGQATGAFTLTRHQAAGAGEHVLAIGPPSRADRAPRAAALATRWGLTAAQRRVLEFVATGASNKAVAASLRCAEATIEFHVTALLAKAECESRAALVARFWSEE